MKIMKINPPPLFQKKNFPKKDNFLVSRNKKKWWGVNPNIFKAYDIRGIYPGEVNANTAYLIGRAYLKSLGRINPKIVVGQDNRFSSPLLFKNLVQGIIDEGGNVIDIGLSTTPMLYFSVAHFKFDGGINITASHLSSEYNGFKLVREKAIPISEKTGLKKIKNLISKKQFPQKREKGKKISKKTLSDYLKFNLKEIDLNNLDPLKIVIDTANAVPSIVVSEFFKKTPLKVYHLFKELDGNFSNHPPDPLIKENLKFLQKEVKDKKADLGIAFDGDGDRIVFVDEKGTIIPGDLITALMAKILLKKYPSEKILYDIRSSNIVKETVWEQGGIPVLYRVGHSFIKEKMRKENTIFAGEFSGHYYSREHYFCEAPFFVLLKILETLSQTKKTLSELIQPFKKYFHSGEINFKVNPVRKPALPPQSDRHYFYGLKKQLSNGVKTPKKILVRLEKKYKKGKISHLDGLRIDFKNWWFLVRASQTEPLLRMILEAKTKDLLEKKQRELIELIKSFVL